MEYRTMGGKDVHSHPVAGPSMQEILDITSAHLYSQDKRSLGPIWDPWLSTTRTCRVVTGPRYKTDNAKPNGECHCAIGIWIDKEYHPSIEGLCLLDLLGAKEYHSYLPDWIKKSWFDKRCHKVDLMNELQSVHDCIHFWEDNGHAGPKLQKELKRLAKLHRLKVTKINKLWTQEKVKKDVKVAKKSKAKDGNKKGKRARSR
jgi:hypothetical protein